MYLSLVTKKETLFHRIFSQSLLSQPVPCSQGASEQSCQTRACVSLPWRVLPNAVMLACFWRTTGNLVSGSNINVFQLYNTP